MHDSQSDNADVTNDAGMTPPERPPKRGRARRRHERRKQRQQQEITEIEQTKLPTPRARPVANETVSDPSPVDDLPLPDTTLEPSRRSRRIETESARKRLDWIPQDAKRRVQQVKPSGGFELPKYIRKDVALPILYLIAGIVLVVGSIAVLGLFRDDPEELPANALWLGTEWTYATPTNEEITELVAELRENEIGTLFAWTSRLDEQGRWIGVGEEGFLEISDTVARFVGQMKSVYPDVTLYAWISVPINVGENGYRLNDEQLQQQVADFSRFSVEELGFDGVFLNVRDIYNDNADDFVSLLQNIRRTLSDDNVLLSVAIPPDWTPSDTTVPSTDIIAPGTEWDKEFKQRVALMSDQMVIMAYNSGLNDPNDYAAWVAYQLDVYADAINELDVEVGPSLLISIPTYDEELPWHNTVAENIGTAIAGVDMGLQQMEDASDALQGLAIFASWETNDLEWREYRRLWVER